MERRRIGCFLPSGGIVGQGKMREMQRARITSRDKSCGFIYDYFEGSMANPMIAACQNRETGRRALFLRGFADDREGK